MAVTSSTKFVPIGYFFLSAMLDLHGNILIVSAYDRINLASVMLLQDFTIPSAVLLSIVVLKIRYLRNHYIAILLSSIGMGLCIYNDLWLKEKREEDYSEEKSQIVGNIMALSGAFMMASNNILAEYILKSQRDVNHYLGFLGLFGSLVALLESAFIFKDLNEFIDRVDGIEFKQAMDISLYLLLFTVANFVCYSLIPVYISKSGATLFNLSNVTTVLWGMLGDILVFHKEFYPLYLLAFFFEITGVLVFSLNKPVKPTDVSQRETQLKSILRSNDQSALIQKSSS